MNYFLINPQGLIENIIVWDGISEYAVPNGYQLVEVGNSEAQIGDTGA